jgi:hypothetical protein
MDAAVSTPQLITPPLDANSFEADGVVYTATDDISIPRYRRYQAWALEFGFDASFRSQYQDKLEIRRLINEQKSISEIAYVNESSIRGMQNVERNEVFELCVCSLWFNAPDEDPTVYNHEAAVAKMNRWEAAGLGVGFFFVKAAACVKGFREAWLQSPALPAPESDPSPTLPSPPSSAS